VSVLQAFTETMAAPAAGAGAGAVVAAAPTAPGSAPSFFDGYEFVKAADGRSFKCCGSGGFGAVFQCIEKATGQLWAVKVIYTSDANAIKMYEREYQRMLALREHILADPDAYSTIVVPKDGFLEHLPTGGLVIRLVMECSPVSVPFAFPARSGEIEPNSATLRSMRSEGSGCDMTGNPIAQPPLTLGQAKFVMRQLLMAIKFFHSQGLIHRDIKPDNMLCWGSADIETSPGVTERVPQVKLSDFGLARTVDEMAELYTRNVGTKSYRAPELLHGKYNNSVDLFAAGCTFFALVLAEQPSDKLDDGFPNRFQHIPASSLLAKFPFESPQLNFLAMLTQKDPALRLTAEQALAHPFLAS